MMFQMQDVWSMQIAYVLISKYDYKVVTTNQFKSDEEIWLGNPNRVDFPIVRVTKSSVARLMFEEKRVIEMHQTILSAFKRQASLLDIHLTDEVVDEERDDLIVACVTAKSKDGFDLKEIYPEIVLSESSEPEKEIEEITKKLETYKAKQKKAFKKNWRNYPVVTIATMAICIAFFIFANIIYYTSGSFEMAMIFAGGLYKTLVYGASEWFRLITAGFLHVELLHFACNALALMNIGMITERMYGHRNYAFIILSSILGSSLFALVGTGNGVTLGISGAVFGILGALLVYFFKTKLIYQKHMMSHFARILILNLFIAFLPGISWLGHLGGFIVGVFMGIILIEQPQWKDIKRSCKVVMIALFTFLIYYANFQDDKLLPIYPGTDIEIIEYAQSLNLDGYANHLNNSLTNYYVERVGVQPDEQ